MLSAALLAPLLLALPQAAGDLDVLLGDLPTLAPPPGALPGEVLAFGDQAFAVASAIAPDAERAVVAATRAGRGRAVAFGHNAFLGGTAQDAHFRLTANALAWAADDALQALDVFVLGDPLTDLEALVETTASGRTLPNPLSAYDAVLWRGGDLAPKEVERLVDYVQAGGGLVLGVCPWGRQQLYGDSGKSIRTDLSHNQVAQRLGLAFGFDTVGATRFTLTPADNARVHAGRAVDAAIAILQDKRPKPDAPTDAARLTGALIRALPPGDPHVAPRLAKALGKLDLAALAPRPDRPVDRRAQPDGTRAHLALVLSSLTWQTAAPQDIPAAPGAEAFPGAIPKSARAVERSFTFQASAPGAWHSTGLYARAGEPLTVTTENAAHWDVRIGAHSDTLWHKETWRRWPEITRVDALPANGTSTHASPFGGLIYLIPRRGAQGHAAFAIEGAVEAPLYIHGDDASRADWKRRRKAPAPWGELISDGVILTLPSAALARLDDPAALMDYWTRAMACYPDLLGKPLHPSGRPERLVEDVQISAGWMHSGYPVMTHGADTPADSAAADLAKLERDGDWGYFHEFGHNAQDARWTFAGTGEVTNNLFSLYLGERMAGIEPWSNPWLENQKRQLAPHLAAGAPYAEWKQKPGLALLTFALVQREFGWAPFQEVLASYTDEVHTPNDDAKRDEWLKRLSRATGRDLGPYFERWGIPVSADARASVADLEPWLPEELKPLDD